jgi:hypothetical protein
VRTFTAGSADLNAGSALLVSVFGDPPQIRDV